MRIRLGDLRRLLREEAMVPGRWYGGEEPEGYDRERVGDPLGMDETDERFEDDGLGNGVEDPNEPEFNDDMAKHLRGDEEKLCLGSPDPEDRTDENVNYEIARFMLQEEPAAASGSDPRGAKGFYKPFDMVNDHTGTDNPNDTWYRSPGREPGGDGDPFRGPDPYSQLGFHPPAAQKDPVTSPPAVDGEEGIAARRTPEIWQLNGGSDTSKMLGANAHASSDGVGSDGEQEEDEKGAEPGESDDEEGGAGEDEG
jgi:hypothetical protein